MAFHVGRKTAFVAHGGADVFVVQNFLQGVKHFAAVTHGFAEGGSTHGNDHQLLQIQAVVGVCTAVDDVHHGHRHLHGAGTTKVTVQRQAAFFCGGAGHGHGHGQRGIGTEAAFVVAAVEVNQGAVQEGLLGGIQTENGFRNFGIHMLHGLEHAFAQVARFVAVAQLNGFA